MFDVLKLVQSIAKFRVKILSLVLWRERLVVTPNLLYIVHFFLWTGSHLRVIYNRRKISQLGHVDLYPLPCP